MLLVALKVTHDAVATLFRRSICRTALNVFGVDRHFGLSVAHGSRVVAADRVRWVQDGASSLSDLDLQSDFGGDEDRKAR